jgi:hypothetical protein
MMERVAAMVENMLSFEDIPDIKSCVVLEISETGVLIGIYWVKNKYIVQVVFDNVLFVVKGRVGTKVVS